MKKSFLALMTLSFFSVGIFFLTSFFRSSQTISGAPPYTLEDEQPPQDLDEYAWLKDWKRPAGPARVGLQVGHWKNEEVPEELHRLIGNTGATGGGKSEWEVNFAIAQKTKEILEENGVVVDLLPATVPEKYWADVFVAIHADGSETSLKSGFKAATPRRDLSGKATSLLTLVEDAYEKATGFEKDPNVTRNMRGYYAFSWWRYTHAVHPMTTALILETGFLTSPSDRRIILKKPEVSAQGLADGVLEFLKKENLLVN